MSPEDFEEVPDEDLREGDVVDVLGVKRILRIRAYEGPLKGIVLGLVDTAPGCGFSIVKGGRTRRAKRAQAT